MRNHSISFLVYLYVAPFTCYFNPDQYDNDDFCRAGMMLPAKRLIKRAKRSSLTRQRSGVLDAFASPPPAHALARKRGVSEPTVLSTPYRLRKVPYPP